MGNTVKRIAVFCSGGDAPGMNAAIRAVVRIGNYHDLHVYGIYNGYDGLIKGDITRLEKGDVANIIHKGGTVLKTARCAEFMTKEGRQKAYNTLMANDIDAIIAIGGNGTFTGASIFYSEHKFPVIGIPGTIDNDIFGTDYTIGFDTAVNTAIDSVDKIRDTADSHNRLFFIEVMGRDSGYIALYTGLGSGASGIMIPESTIDVDVLVKELEKMVIKKKLFGLVIVAEGNENGNAQEIADLIAKRFSDYETKVAVIGHLQRGGSPTAMDRVLATRMGHGAVEGLLAGQKNVMCGIHNNEVVFVPLKDAIKKIKPIDDSLLSLPAKLS